MNTDILQQEILLLTGTSFSQRQLCDRDGKNDSKDLPESEKLEKAKALVAGTLNLRCKLNYQNTLQSKSSFLLILITF